MDSRLDHARIVLLEEMLKTLIVEVRSPRISLSVNDAEFLVAIAVKHEEITTARAAEFLGLSHEEALGRMERWK